MIRYIFCVLMFFSYLLPSIASSPVSTDIFRENREFENKIFAFTVEQQAEFQGGNRALLDWISSNKRYPEECYKNGIEGRVIVKFKIEKDGTVSNVTVLRGIHPLLDAEAIRLVESMPKWMPGRIYGEPAATTLFLPVTFKIHEEE